MFRNSTLSDFSNIHRNIELNSFKINEYNIYYYTLYKANNNFITLYNEIKQMEQILNWINDNPDKYFSGHVKSVTLGIIDFVFKGISLGMPLISLNVLLPDTINLDTNFLNFYPNVIKNLKEIRINNYLNISLFPKLRVLKLYKCNNTDVLFSQPSNIEKIKMNLSKPVNSLANMKNLKHLELFESIPVDIEELEFLETLVVCNAVIEIALPRNLKFLILNRCSIMKNDCILHCNKLKKLIIRKCSALPILSSNNIIEDFVIRTEQFNLSYIFPQIKRLKIEDIAYVDLSIYEKTLTDLTILKHENNFLRRFSYLKVLELNELVPEYLISGDNLEELYIMDCKNSYIDFSKFKKLKILHLNNINFPNHVNILPNSLENLVIKDFSDESNNIIINIPFLKKLKIKTIHKNFLIVTNDYIEYLYIRDYCKINISNTFLNLKYLNVDANKYNYLSFPDVEILELSFEKLEFFDTYRFANTYKSLKVLIIRTSIVSDISIVLTNKYLKLVMTSIPVTVNNIKIAVHIIPSDLKTESCIKSIVDNRKSLNLREYFVVNRVSRIQ